MDDYGYCSLNTQLLLASTRARMSVSVCEYVLKDGIIKASPKEYTKHSKQNIHAHVGYVLDIKHRSTSTVEWQNNEN